MIVKKIKNYLILFIAVVFYVAQEERKESYIAFENGEEIICDNFIVSKKLGFKFDKNNKHRVSDDKNSFILYNCISKKNRVKNIKGSICGIADESK